MNTNEIFVLKSILNAMEISYELEDLYDGYKLTIFDYNGKYLDDAVIHKWSHGSQEGLLETYNLNDCDGYEKAIDIAYGWYHKYFEKN